MTDLDLLNIRDAEFDRLHVSRHVEREDFEAGFTSGVTAIVSQLKDDLRKARNTEAIARQQATDCNYPADAMSYMRGACEARYKVEYLETLIYNLTGEEY
jgi:hypothetical protein